MDKINILKNLKRSIYEYLIVAKHEELGDKTLPEYFEGLEILMAFPEDMRKLKSPTLALEHLIDDPTDTLGYGDADGEISTSWTIYIFAGWKGRTEKNKELRDKLIFALRAILEDEIGQYRQIPMYDFAKEGNPKYGQLEIFDVSSSELRPEGNLEAMKYRAIVDFNTLFKMDNN